MKEVIITSSALILCIMLIRVIFKGKISSRLQYALWILVVLRLIVPVSAQVYMAIGSVEEFRIMDLTKMIEERVGDVTEQLEQPITFTTSVGGPVGKLAAEYILRQNADSLNTGDGPTSVFYAGKIGLTWLDVLRRIWIGGMIVMTLWMVITNIVFAHRLHKGRKEFVLSESTDENLPRNNTKIYTMEGLVSPCLYGIPLKEAIYLTPDIAEDKDRLRHVLTHELCHKKHGDSFWSIMRSILLIVYWMNPLVWVAAVLSKRDCELACDEAALLMLDEEERISYGETLLSIITGKGRLSDIVCTATTMTGSGKSVKERIKFIAEKPHVLGITVAAVLTLVIAVSVLVFTKNPLFHGDTWEGETTLTAGDMQITLPETIAGISGYEMTGDGDIIIYQVSSGEEVGRFCEVSYGEAVVMTEQGREVIPIGDYGRNLYLKEYMISLYPTEKVTHTYTPNNSTTHNYTPSDSSSDNFGVLQHENYYENINEPDESYSEGVPGTDSNNDDTTYIIEDESIRQPIIREHRVPVFDEDGNIVGYSYSPDSKWQIPSPEGTEWGVIPLSEEELKSNLAHEDVYNSEAINGLDSVDDETTYIIGYDETEITYVIGEDNMSTTSNSEESRDYQPEEINSVDQSEESVDYLPNEEIIVTYIPANTSTKCYIYVKGDYSGVEAQYLNEIAYINSELLSVIGRVIVTESD